MQGLACLLQEVLLILEECWNNSPELQNVPIYQASGLARRAISVYQTYIEMMNDDIKAAFQACCASLMLFLAGQGRQVDAETNCNLPYWLADHQNLKSGDHHLSW